ncbi:carboxypeptidase regulatory-like domain-containing protein [Mucilaginibacter sp. Bleaf8]|uniref:MSCRAMM family protein n=1 Tax=Mucilaginibacter sp. Bleaf8 TaxID=2834430 RepID=UPI001BD03BB9|nr:carboxypeptidase-like regulatory domain-containing protein [Mucilaginibacter sp. Bleaf8]MBS7563870.1 carboxypeptidase regulatory-like domain-containing protein [Mucilaginibacter sp. Bleaf8]
MPVTVGFGSIKARLFWFICLVLVFDGIESKAQQASGIRCFFEQDTLVINHNGTFSNKLHLINTTPTTVYLTRAHSTDEGMLITPPDTLMLPPNAERTFPVKYLSSNRTIHHALQLFAVHYRTTTQPAQQITGSFYTQLDEPGQFLLQAIDPVIYVDQQTARLSARFKMLNKRYDAVNVNIRIKSSSEALQVPIPVQQLLMDAGAERLVVFEAHLAAKKINQPDMQLQVFAEDATGKLLAERQIKVVVLSSNKSVLLTPSLMMPDNSLELTAISGNDNNQYLLRGNGNFRLEKDSRLSYNLNANYYNAIAAYDLRDTYISFDSKHAGVKTGTIGENLEMPLYGRGIKAYGSVSKSTVNLYYVNNAYLLYSSQHATLLNHAPNTLAGNYRYQKSENTYWEATYIHQSDDVQQLRTNLAHVNSHMQLSSNQLLEVTAGYSTESRTTNNTNQIGYAGGINYTGSFGSFELSSGNFMSSSYYSGLRRGTLQLNEQLSYSAPNGLKLVARFTRLRNNPQYLTDQTFLASYNDMSSYEVAASFQPIKRLFVSLRPYLQQQNVSALQFAPAESGKLSAIAHRIAADFRYSLSGAHSLSFNADYGILCNRELTDDQGQKSVRLSLNYYSGQFGLNAFALIGPYYLLDQYYLLYKQYNTNYALAPYVNFSMFRHKLNLNLSHSFNYSKSYVRSFNAGFSGLAKLNLPGNWALSGQVYYNRYAGYSRYQTQLGVIKNFNVAGSAGRHKLELSFFEDANGNGVHDNQEKLVPGVLVSMDQTIARSNQHGEVTYIDVPAGMHQIQVIDAKGRSTNTIGNILLKKNTRQLIALTRNASLTGRIQPVKQKYQQTAVLLEGIRITATDAQNRTFFTLTDENGEFNLFLPVNQYTITTSASGNGYTIRNPSQSIQVAQTTSEPVIFTLIDNSQKVQVQRF